MSKNYPKNTPMNLKDVMNKQIKRGVVCAECFQPIHDV